jgi:ABC-type transporter Mla subunit MlaD
METSEKKIPNFVFEDLLFERRLCRTLNAEQEKLNALLAEHVRLLAERRALMAEIHESVQQRWETEEAAASNVHPIPETKEASDAD